MRFAYSTGRAPVHAPLAIAHSMRWMRRSCAREMFFEPQH
jgi:hypothetical protein